MEFSNRLGALLTGAALAATPTPQPAQGNLPAGAREALAAGDVPKAPPSRYVDPLMQQEPIRQPDSVLRGAKPNPAGVRSPTEINDPQVISRVEGTITEILHPRGGVVTDQAIAPLLQLTLKGTEAERAASEQAVLSTAAKDVLRDLIFAESLNPDDPYMKLEPIYGAGSQAFREAYWTKFIKGTADQARIKSPDDLRDVKVLETHLSCNGRLRMSFAELTPSDQQLHREMLAEMLKGSAPLHAPEIDQRLGTKGAIDPRLQKTIELMKRPAPQHDEAQAAYVREVVAELQKMPEGLSKTNAVKQVEARVKEMGPVALVTFREEMADSAEAKTAKLADSPVKNTEAAKPQMTALQQKASRVSNPTQVPQEIRSLVDEWGPDPKTVAKTVAEFLSALPERFKPGTQDNARDMEKINNGLRSRNLNLDLIVEQAPLEERKVIAPYILGGNAGVDAAKIKGALQRSSDLSSVVGQIRSEVIAEQGRDQHAINERLSEAVKYYNWIEREPGAAPLQESALHRIAEQQQAQERSSERASKRRRE